MKMSPENKLIPVTFASALPAVCETAQMPRKRMLPLAQLSRESREPTGHLRGLRGVLTDIDDTLTRDGAIEPVALDALHALRAGGVEVVAITGRPAGWSEPFALAWPVAAIVAENGGVMLRAENGRLVRDFAQPEAERQVNTLRLAACAAAVLREVPGATLAADSAGRLTDIAVDHSEFANLDAERIAQVVAVMQQHGLRATVSSIHVNGWIGEHSKWSAAQWAVHHCTGAPLDVAEWVYVGDSTNDQLMFEHIPLSVAVANIARFVPELDVLPAYVTQGERGVGFAELARAVIAARGTA
jgi:HAD superfamily hydrolase (TIGR01484 family)